MQKTIFTEDRTFTKGDSHPSISNVHEYLIRLGYSSLAEVSSITKTDLFDDRLENSIIKYQRFLGIEVTGELDKATRDLMEMPRCGVPDLLLGQELSTDTLDNYVLSGGRWPSYDIRFRFMNGTNDITGTTEYDIVRQAFDIWEEATDLNFIEIADTSTTEIDISWETGDHGDGSPFDGTGHTLAHAFFPPPINPHPGIAGDVHFDDAEAWSNSGSGQTIDLLSVAIHELGHALGLRHSSEPNAIMYPTYSGPKRTLHEDDIRGIRAIYPIYKKPWILYLLIRILRFIGVQRRLYNINY